ncbi:MAG: hypothetical protein ACXAEX_16685 [Promethearchaeota archaeon]
MFNKKDMIYTLLISFGIIIVGAVLTNLNGFTSFLLFFIDINQEDMHFIIQIIMGLSFIFNFFTFFIIVEAISRIFYKKKANTIDFLISFAVIQLPMILYLFIHTLFEITGTISINVVNFVDEALMIIFQVWSLWLLSYSLSVKKGLKIENSLIISLFLHMLPFTLILLTFI